jgi:hypothetical protein
MKLGYPTGFAGIALPVAALIAYVLIAHVAVRTVDGPPAVSPGPTRVQTVAVHVDPAQAKSSFTGVPGAAASTEPKRVQTVTVHVDPAQAKSSFTRAFEIPAP